MQSFGKQPVTSLGGHMKVEDSIERAARVLQEAESVLITAGAGIGVDSGLPDFRGDRGFWKAYPPIAELGIGFVEMANPKWFQQDRELAWAFYGHRLNLYRRTQPHQGFHRLLEIVSRKRGGYFVFTSNVDGQFQKAGFGEQRIEECHGSIHHLQCTVPCCSEIWESRDIQVLVDEERFRATEPLPLCPQCGELARPNILMFGDWTWLGTRAEIQAQRRQSWLKQLGEKSLKTAVIEAGAGKAVPTVRRFSESIAHSLGGTLIRINPRDSEVPNQEDISLPLGSEEAIRKISREYEANR